MNETESGPVPAGFTPARVPAGVVDRRGPAAVEATLPTVRVVAGQSVGKPHDGELVAAARLPYDPGYYRRRLERTYAAQHVVDHLRRVVLKVRRGHPRLHRLAIGDLSSRKGGRLAGHQSHQSGRDVDLGLYFERAPEGYPQRFVRAEDGELDRAATWALIKALHVASKDPGGPQVVFLDYRVQGTLYEFARGQGVSKRELESIFQYPDGRSAPNRLVRHEPLHGDHMHVRFACPDGDPQCH